MATRARIDDPLDALTAALGSDAVITDADALDLYGHDVFARGAPLLAVLRPRDVAALQAAVATATAHGLAVIPRGGGMSYTGGYLAAAPDAVLIDTGAMDRVLAIDPVDMTVTVEAGCPWAKLHEALKPYKLRAPGWGTLSGRYATVGGGMSQNGMFWGARGGPLSESAVGFQLVLADGSLLDTAAATGGGFLRPFGPDLTGLFAADCGAFGVKATVTLRLVPDGPAFAYGSWSLPTVEALLAASSDVARAGLAAELFGFDPFLQAQRMKRESLATDAKALLGVMKAQGSILGALKEGARVVAAGRSFLDDAPASLHAIAEARSQPAADADMAAIDAILRRHGATAVDATIPKVLRANPFPPVNSMLGPDGERWVPVHGIVRHSAAAATHAAIAALYAEHAPAMADHGIGAGAMYAAVGSAGVLIEPVFFWPDATEAIHRASVEPGHLARLKRHEPNVAARAVVERLRTAIVDILAAHGALHFQIGRTYRWLDRLDAPGQALARALKAAVDPKGLMNPGSLGL